MEFIKGKIGYIIVIIIIIVMYFSHEKESFLDGCNRKYSIWKANVLKSDTLYSCNTNNSILFVPALENQYLKAEVKKLKIKNKWRKNNNSKKR